MRAQQEIRPRPARMLLWAALAFFAVMGVWADRAVLDEVTSGEGRVVPSRQVQVVQNLEGGILKELLVDDGAIVERDQVLLRIDNSGFASSLGEARARQLSLRAQATRLAAEAAGAAAPEFPPDLVAEAPQVAADEARVFAARAATLEGQIAVLRRQVEQRRQELAEIESRLSHLGRGLALAREEHAIIAPLAARGVAPRTEDIRLRRQIAELEGEAAAARLNLPRAASAIEEAEARIAERRLDFRAEAERELAQARASLAVLDETLGAARDRVERGEVRSPVRGIVKQVKVRTLGGAVKPGMDLVEIVPLDDTLLVEARIRPADIAFLRPGQPATVRITAYDFAVFGGLAAQVERIGADTIEDERGESFYPIVVRTGKNHLGGAEAPLPIIPGMVATVDVLTGRKSVLAYLLGPILKARERALRER